jgi:uncharacterized protein
VALKGFACQHGEVMNHRSDFIEETITISKYPINQENFLHLNEHLPWIKELLSELENDALGSASAMKEGDDASSPESTLEVQLSIIRKSDEALKDHLIICGKIKGQYQTACIRCLEAFTSPVEAEFNTCFLHSALENTPEYEGITEIYLEQKEMDIYYHQKGKIDLKELIHENLYLSRTPFPLHAVDCKGLCPVCGSNLNYEACQH